MAVRFHPTALIGFAGMLLLLAGCATPDLRLVSKPAMQFGETRGYASTWRMASQLEPGRVATGGAQASVCACGR